jgi:class 3 adenylate cyclase
VGLNSGEVTSRDDDVFGAAVNAAARITAKAGPGETLVAEVVKQLAGTIPDLTFRDRGRFRLKGFPDRWRLFEVVWQQEQAVASPVAPIMDRAALVGRDVS